MRCVLLFVCVTIFTSTVSFGQKVTGDEFRKLNTEMREAFQRGENDKALTLAQRLVGISEQEFGAGAIATGLAIKNRGAVEEAKGDDKAAERSFDAAIDIYKKHKATLGKADAAGLADALESLGRVRAKTDVFWTESIFKEALDWRERAGGKDSVETVAPVVQLANINFWKRDYKKSADLYTRALTTLADSSTASGDDITFVFYRTQCSYRKAKMEEKFGLLKAAHGAAAEFSSTLPRKPKFINAGLVNARAVHIQRPRWPAEARNANSDGDVEVDVLIDERGEVISACSKNGGPHAALVEAAEVAAYKSRFSASTLQGNPVKVSGRLLYKFVRKF